MEGVEEIVNGEEKEGEGEGGMEVGVVGYALFLLFFVKHKVEGSPIFGFGLDDFGETSTREKEEMEETVEIVEIEEMDWFIDIGVSVGWVGTADKGGEEREERGEESGRQGSDEEEDEQEIEREAAENNEEETDETDEAEEVEGGESEGEREGEGGSEGMLEELKSVGDSETIMLGEIDEREGEREVIKGEPIGLSSFALCWLTFLFLKYCNK